MPQAIDLSLATPMTRPRLPAMSAPLGKVHSSAIAALLSETRGVWRDVSARGGRGQARPLDSSVLRYIFTIYLSKENGVSKCVVMDMAAGAAATGRNGPAGPA